jgi:hypothetical protein
MMTTVSVIVGFLAVCGIVWRMAWGAVTRNRLALQEQMDQLSARVECLERKGVQAAAVASGRAPEAVDASAVAAGVIAFESRKVLVRRLKTPSAPHPPGGAWAEQGWAEVHASHDIAQRGR